MRRRRFRVYRVIHTDYRNVPVGRIVTCAGLLMLWASGKTRNGTHEERVRGPYSLRPSRPPEHDALHLERESADQPSRHGEGPCPDEQLRPVRHRAHGESRSIRHLWPSHIHDPTRGSKLLRTTLGQHHETLAAELYRADRKEHPRRLGGRQPTDTNPHTAPRRTR